jgi:hypothetical protein
MLDHLYEVHTYSANALFEACASAHFPLENVKVYPRAKYLDRYLSRLRAQTLVVENHYTDGDYLDDFANYYVRSFVDYSRRCKRLHFFSCAFDESGFRERLLGGFPQDLQDNYLGFAVIRPLPNAIFGRTVLATYPITANRQYPSIRSYAANLFGTELRVNSLAFQEQDTVIAACATVALWSAFQKTATLFRSRMPTPAEITRTATSSTFHSRPLPSRGLTLAQMAHAVKDVGLEPEVIECGPGVPLLSLIYGYLGLGVPVVLGLEIEHHGLHAVTVTGYSLKDSPHLQREDNYSGKTPLNRIGRRINQLFLHDDGFGPFVKVATEEQISTPAGSVVQLSGTWTVPDHPGTFAKLKPIWAMIPAYNKIRLTYMDIQKSVLLMNYLLAQVLPSMVDTEWDISLSDNNTLKAHVKAWNLSADLLEGVLVQSLPRFVWRATLSIDRIPSLEMVFDATGIARSFSVLQVVFRRDELRDALRAVVHYAGFQKLLGPDFTKLLMETTG